MNTGRIAVAGLMLAGIPALAQITSLQSPNANRPNGRLGSFEGSLAGDGDRLLVFYCEEEFFPLDATVTVVKEWNGNQWIDRAAIFLSTTMSVDTGILPWRATSSPRPG